MYPYVSPCCITVCTLYAQQPQRTQYQVATVYSSSVMLLVAMPHSVARAELTVPTWFANSTSCSTSSVVTLLYICRILIIHTCTQHRSTVRCCEVVGDNGLRCVMGRGVPAFHPTGERALISQSTRSRARHTLIIFSSGFASRIHRKAWRAHANTT